MEVPECSNELTKIKDNLFPTYSVCLRPSPLYTILSHEYSSPSLTDLAAIIFPLDQGPHIGPGALVIVSLVLPLGIADVPSWFVTCELFVIF